MKKILLLMALVLPFVLASCGDDKDEPLGLEQQLIGSWTGREIMGSQIDPVVHSFTFNADHTGKYSWVKTQGPLSKASYSSGGYDFKWKLKKNVLSITQVGDDEGTSKYEISIENGVLKIMMGGISNNYYEFHRVQG